MGKALLIIVGSLFVGLGFVGVILPGLPTTPFLLVAAGCYAKSSDRFYKRLINSRTFGPMIRQYRERRSLPKRIKVRAIVMMWTMISLSGIFAITGTTGRIILFVCGLIGMFSVLSVKTEG